ncbi:MAG: autotransporter domain-containing protein, partial [Pseudomonadota bacterium]
MRSALLTFFLFTSGVSAFGADEFIDLSDPTAGSLNGLAQAVSADGKVTVGTLRFNSAFRWSADTGTQALGSTMGGRFSGGGALDVSGDGSVIVGWSTESFSNSQAFVWTEQTGMVGIGRLPGDARSIAEGVSADGQVVVGTSTELRGSVFLSSQAFRWTESGGMVGLGDLEGGEFGSRATAVSADGSVVVGQGRSDRGFEAIRWTEELGMVALADLPDGRQTAFASDVSADGQVIVGNARAVTGPGLEAFRWTEDGGAVGLGDLLGGEFYSAAFAVNAGGNVVVGRSVDAAGDQAYRWTTANGMQTVADWLAESDVTLEGWRLTTANDVSAFGDVVVGVGFNPDGEFTGWIARVGSGLIGTESFTESLALNESLISHGRYLTGLVLNGSHHRPLLMTRFGDAGGCAWATGDFSQDNLGVETDTAIGEIGVCTDLIADNLRIGLGVGRSEVEQQVASFGNSRTDGNYVVGEIEKFLGPTALVSLTLLYGSLDSELKREYDNAGMAVVSNAQTTYEVSSARIRLHAVDVFNSRRVTITPRAAFTFARYEVDPYSETGGGFPVSVEGQKQYSREMRVGLDVGYAVTSKLNLFGMLEGVGEFENSPSDLRGEVGGLFGFQLESESGPKAWARA